MARRSSTPRVLEKVEQTHIVQLARSVGCAVTVYGTVRRGSTCPQCGARVAGHRGTQQTPGAADLEVWLPVHARGGAELVKWETKSATGRLSPEQLVYRDQCGLAGVTWGSGTFADFERFLADRGLVRLENIPHYRRWPEDR